MNLAGNQAKQLFKTLRTGGRPPTVALWAAASVVDQLRKRGRPERELIATKKLKPGESYMIRVPKEGEASLASSLGKGTVATVTQTSDRSIASELLAAATDLIGAATAPDDEETTSPTLTRRQRRKAGSVSTAADEPTMSDPEQPPRLSRRKARLAKRVASLEQLDAERQSLSRRARRKVGRVDLAEPESEPEESPAPGRRKARRAERVASLDQLDLDRQSLPRRRRRKLKRAETRARRRPSGRRMRKARRQQNQAATITGAACPSRRGRRQLKAAQREVEYRSAKIERRSTRRRRRRLKKAEKALARLIG